MPNLLPISLSICDIDLSQNYSISFPLENKELTESIKRVGQISPIIVTKNANKYNIISGIRRFCALRTLNINKVKALFVDGVSDNIDLFTIELEEKISKRSLNIFEKSNVIKILSDSFGLSNEEIRVKYLEILGFEKNEEYIHKLKRISEFDEPLKHKMVNNLTDSHILLLAGIKNKRVLDMMIDIIFKYHINYYLTLEMVEYLEDIEHKKKITQDKILEEILIKIEPLRLKAKVAGRRIRESLFNERYPSIVNEKKRIMDGFRDIKLPSNVELILPQKIGEDFVKIVINFISSRDVGEKIKSLHEKKDEILKLFNNR